MRHYHPPTCKANLALTSLHAPLCRGHGLGKKKIYHRSGKKKKENSEVEQIPPLTLTHTPLVILFFATLLCCTHQLLTQLWRSWFFPLSPQASAFYSEELNSSSRSHFREQQQQKQQRQLRLERQKKKKLWDNFKVRQRTSFCPELCERCFWMRAFFTPETRLCVSVSKKEETLRLRFRLVSFRRANKHLFTVGAEAAKEARPSESPLGSSSSVFLNFFSPLSRSGSPPPLFELTEGTPRVCVCVSLWCVCAPPKGCVCVSTPLCCCVRSGAQI